MGAIFSSSPSRRVTRAHALGLYQAWIRTFLPKHKRGKRKGQLIENPTDEQRVLARRAAWAQLDRASRRALGDYRGGNRLFSGTLAPSIKTRRR